MVDLGCRFPELVGLGSFAESTSEAREDLVSRYPDDNCGLNPFVGLFKLTLTESANPHRIHLNEQRAKGKEPSATMGLRFRFEDLEEEGL